ncbi:MAG: alpha/beta hydrolase [Candidatus Hydrogenedentes bacterium]|nr:alpha/beta hydrolase [Candidatus Hydrogenedentota bacterium]
MKHKVLRIGFAVVLLLFAAAGSGAWLLSGKAFERTPGQYFDSNGVRIYYIEEGKGEPVILVHGFAANADLNWRMPKIIEDLSKDYRVIALDNRGHGLSDKPHEAGKYGLEMVEDVVRLMDHLKIEKAHVVGYSMGAFITLKLITMHPERLLSAAPCGGGWEKNAGEDRQVWRTELIASLEQGNGFGPLMTLVDPKRGLFSGIRKWTVNRTLKGLNDQAALAEVLRELPQLAVTEEQLRANTVPTLSIVGSDDPLKTGVDNMTGVMANLEVVVIQGGNHITLLRKKEHSEQFIKALREFLAKHRATAAALGEDATREVQYAPYRWAASMKAM